MTQTAGLGYWFFYADLKRFEEMTGLPNVGASGTGFAAFRSPLLADPGTTWVYGISHDWLGRVVEAVSGMSLDIAVKERLSTPLALENTTFIVNEKQLQAEVPLHVPQDGGWLPTGPASVDRPWLSGGDGLHSTPRDFARLGRALLLGGAIDGNRVLTRRSVEELFTTQINGIAVPQELASADPVITDSWRLGPNRAWSHGLMLNLDDVAGGRRAGSAGWSGLFNTNFWVDRTSGISACICTSALPFMARSGAAQLFDNFESAVYSQL